MTHSALVATVESRRTMYVYKPIIERYIQSKLQIIRIRERDSDAAVLTLLYKDIAGLAPAIMQVCGLAIRAPGLASS